MALAGQNAVDTANKDGVTALMHSSWKRHSDVVTLLLEKGATVDTANKDGVTALMATQQNGHSDVAKLLLEKGATVDTANEDGDNTLIMASAKGNSDLVKLLLKKGATVNTADKNGWTALIWASWIGHSDVVKLLLEKGATVNTADKNGWTALILASWIGHSDVVKLLLEKGATVDTANKNGFTALIPASDQGHCDVVKLLLEKGATVDTADKNSYTALMHASWEGHSDVVKLLLEKGATVDTADKDGNTALIQASWEGHSDVVKLLLKKGATVDTANKNGFTALIPASDQGHCDVVKLLLEKGATVNKADKYGLTALIRASEEGHSDVVKLLLEKGATVDTDDKDVRTALIYASIRGHSDVVKLLLEKGATVNTADKDGYTALIDATAVGPFSYLSWYLGHGAAVDTANEDGWTALTWASWRGHSDVVKLLLEMGATVDTINNDGSTALMQASAIGHSDVVKLLLEKGATVDTADKDGNTALIQKSEEGHSDVVKLLLENGATVNTANKDGNTALIQESDKGHSDVVKLLLENGATVNTANKDGYTALTWASWNGHSDVVKLLLEKGATVDTSNKDGNTAFLGASMKGHSDVVKFLLEKGATVDIANKDGSIALIWASITGQSDVVKLLLEKGATVDTADDDGWTALKYANQRGYCEIVRLLERHIEHAEQDLESSLMSACHQGQWDAVKELINAGANISHVSMEGETAAMYIIFTLIAQRCDPLLIECVKQGIQNPTFPKSHYAMSNASFSLIGALLYNANTEWFDCDFAKSTLQEDLLYAFLPYYFLRHDGDFIIHGSESNGHLFSPYQGVEGKISLHTLATAVVCTLPNTALQWLTPQHRDTLVNMLGQTPLHLLAMYGGSIGDMEEKILLLTETLCFSFSDRDNNGRVPYHIACLCFNYQFLLCGQKLDSAFRTNILEHDNLDKTPPCLLSYAVKSSEIPLENLPSAKKTMEVLQQITGPVLTRNTQQKACTSHRTSNNAINRLKECFKDKTTVQDLTEMTDMAKKISFDTNDIAWLFKCRNRSIVNLTDKQPTVTSVIHLLKLIGSEMGKMDPLLQCEPELKGSIQEYTKCVELDELDISMKLVNCIDYFTMGIKAIGIKRNAKITPVLDSNRYWRADRFSSVEFCADFWQLLLKALDAEPVQNYIKNNGLIIENCRRKNGFVGMLIISCRVGDSIQLISVDIAPSIASNNLDGYIALLRPRVYDNKVVGDEFYQGLELSSSHRDWEFLKYLQPEVICGYALVKMLRCMAGPFQTEKGRTYTAEDILPSYMLKTALLWILDPEEWSRPRIYKDLEIDLVFDSEDSSRCETDVASLCLEILQGPHVSADKVDVDSLKEDIREDPHVSGLHSFDRDRVFDIYKKCTKANKVLTAKKRILPYAVATKCCGKQEQNGINLEWMEENCKPDTRK